MDALHVPVSSDRVNWALGAPSRLTFIELAHAVHEYMSVSNGTRDHPCKLPHLAKGNGLCVHRWSTRLKLTTFNDSTQYAELFEAKPDPLFRVRCIRRAPSARVVPRTVDEDVLGGVFPAVFGRPGDLILDGHDFRFVSCSAHGRACLRLRASGYEGLTGVVEVRGRATEEWRRL